MAVLQLFPPLSLQTRAGQKQRMFGLDQIDILGSTLDQQPDTYVSQATFVGDTRRKCFFSRVRSCWVDLDLHTQGMVLDAQTVNDIRLHCDSLELPQPTMIISSGRGAYLKWILQRAVTDLPTWEAAQSMLVLLFQNFCSDKRARDACRVFRMLGTINSKVDDAERQRVAAIDGAGEEVAFETLALALEHARQFIDLPSNIGSNGINGKQRKPRSDVLNRMGKRLLHAAERGSVDELKLYSRLREPILMSGKLTPASLGWSRFCDLRDLYIQRGGIPVGERDLAMFWMINCLGHAGIVTPANFQEEVLGLLHAFPQGVDSYEPLSDGSLQTLQSRLFKTHQIKTSIQKDEGEPDISGRMVNTSDLLYRPGNAYLIEAFGITEQEQESLKTLIGAKEKRRRADFKAPGRSDRREQRQLLREKVRAWLQAQNWKCDNISALARDLNDANGRVWRAVKACLQDRDCAEGRAAGDVKKVVKKVPRNDANTEIDAEIDAGIHVAVRDGPGDDPNDHSSMANPIDTGQAGTSKDPAKSTPMSAASSAPMWSVPAHTFFGFAPKKRRRTTLRAQFQDQSRHASGLAHQKTRSILGRYGHKHAKSLEALRAATARPKWAGVKHWIGAFAKDIADYYRQHAQWPSASERMEMMNWHRQQYVVNKSSSHPRKHDKIEQPRQQIPEKTTLLTELSRNLSSKSKYLSVKDFYIRHYGERGAEQWESMTSVQRLHAAIEMERDIWDRARSEAQDQMRSTKEEIRERWQRVAQKDREKAKEMKIRMEQESRRHVGRVTGRLRNTWGRLHPDEQAATSSADA